MYDRPARVLRTQFPEGKRILVISDIHGNLPYLKGVLARAGFRPGEDILVINGDFLEKGPDSLGTLRYMMELSAKGNVYALCGNCDGWHNIFSYSDDWAGHTIEYIHGKKSGLLWEMCLELGLDPMAVEHFSQIRGKLDQFAPEWDYMRSMPDAIETENFIFAHAGMDPSKSLDEHTRGELSRIDRFMDKGYSFSKWLIVGHYPVMLYGENIVCANPIIDRQRRIASIDGACVLKDDGQLNALIIPHSHSEDFSFVAYDPFPLRRVLSDQAEGDRSYYIRWGDSRVQVLQRGEEFSHCRHVRTGYEMDILTKYLFTDNEFTNCNDCTDYVLPLKKGDIVGVVESCSRGYFVKHEGVSGWYFGELE